MYITGTRALVKSLENIFEKYHYQKFLRFSAVSTCKKVFYESVIKTLKIYALGGRKVFLLIFTIFSSPSFHFLTWNKLFIKICWQRQLCLLTELKCFSKTWKNKPASENCQFYNETFQNLDPCLKKWDR